LSGYHQPMPLRGANEVFPGLWQGSAPPEGADLAESGFDALVLCAAEHQPGPHLFPGLRTVVAVYLSDAGEPPTARELDSAVAASRAVASLVLSGRTVLVTCAVGLNRSGLVTALSLLQIEPTMTADEAVRLVRLARPRALGNEWFVDFVHRCHRLWHGRTRPRRLRSRRQARPS
jgi:hypothetical protein